MRLHKLIFSDIYFQWRYGFYFIYLVLTLLYICILGALPEAWRQNASAVMIYSDPAAMGLFFMGAMVLLEKSQRVLDAMAISPMKISEYILSKAMALVLISCAVAAALGIASGSDSILSILGGTAVTSAIYTMLGMIAATKIKNLNQFFIYILPIELICFLPPIINLFIPLPRGFKFFPFVACMNLIRSDSQFLLLDLSLVLVTLIVLYRVAYSQVSRMWQSIGGVKL